MRRDSEIICNQRGESDRPLGEIVGIVCGNTDLGYSRDFKSLEPAAGQRQTVLNVDVVRVSGVAHVDQPVAREIGGFLSKEL